MVYAIPAIIGLLIKMIILFFASSSKKSKVFICFIASISIHNISELILFFHIFNKTDPTIALKIYYSCLIGGIAAMCVYTTSIFNKNWLKTIIKIVTSLSLIIICLLMFTPMIINGYKPLGELVTASKGSFYFIFQSVAISALLYSFISLIYTCLTNKETEKKVRAAYVLASFIPVILTGLSIIFLMILGIQINAIALLPIATTLLLLITLKAEKNHSITDIRMYMPFSKERKISQNLIHIISDYSVSDKDYRNTVKDIERVLLSYSYEKTNFCKSKTAEKLNVSRSTLYSMFDRLNVEK